MRLRTKELGELCERLWKALGFIKLRPLSKKPSSHLNKLTSGENGCSTRLAEACIKPSDVGLSVGLSSRGKTERKEEILPPEKLIFTHSVPVKAVCVLELSEIYALLDQFHFSAHASWMFDHFLPHQQPLGLQVLACSGRLEQAQLYEPILSCMSNLAELHADESRESGNINV